MSDAEIMKALDAEINSCIENHCEKAFTANACLKNMILRLQKENAELRECLKKIILVAENRMPKHQTLLEVEYINDAKAALEGGNHAND